MLSKLLGRILKALSDVARQLKNLMGVGVGAQSAQLINGTVFDGLTATGSVQADALPLPGDVNALTTVLSGSGVRLPSVPQPSDEIVVANFGANAVNVYPGVGGSIQGGAVNLPFSLPAGAVSAFIARTGSLNWTALASSGSVATAPVLSSPTAVQSTSTSAILGVSTNQSAGTLYWVVSTSATPPSAVQLIAGNDSTGSAAVASGSQAVIASGTQGAVATGLTTGVTYYAYFVHSNSGLQSNIAASASFTLASLAQPTLTNSSTLGAAPLVLSWSSTDYTAGLYGQLQIATDSGFSSIAQNIVFFIDGTSWARLDEAIGLITPSGTYYARIRTVRDNESGATTVTGTDPSGAAVSFDADVSSWSTTFTDTISVASAVWNGASGANKSSFLTVSGSPALVVTGPGGGFSGAPCSVRATAAATGKKHFELTYTTVSGSGDSYVGVEDGTSVFGPGSLFPKPSPGILYRDDGIIYVNASVSQTGLPTIAQGDVVAVEFDTVGGTVKFFKNGTQAGSTVTGVSLSSWYACCSDEKSDVLTGNFGQNTFSMTPSTGYTMYG